MLAIGKHGQQHNEQKNQQDRHRQNHGKLDIVAAHPILEVARGSLKLKGTVAQLFRLVGQIVKVLTPL